MYYDPAPVLSAGERDYQGLGQPEGTIGTVTGRVTFFTGGQTVSDSHHRVRVEKLEEWKANYNAAGGGADYDRDVVELWRKEFSCQGPNDPPGGIPCTMVALGYVDIHEGAYGRIGWQIYVPALISLGGGSFNPGYLDLEGDTAGLQEGQQTITGYYTGTRPNDLFFGVPWSFWVDPSAAAAPDTGSVVDEEEMVELRLQSIEEIEGEAAAAEARARHEANLAAEEEAARLWAEEEAERLAAEEEAARLEAELEAARLENERLEAEAAAAHEEAQRLQAEADAARLAAEEADAAEEEAARLEAERLQAEADAAAAHLAAANLEIEAQRLQAEADAARLAALEADAAEAEEAREKAERLQAEADAAAARLAAANAAANTAASSAGWPRPPTTGGAPATATVTVTTPSAGPPVLAAGLPTGTLAAIIVGALFFLPMLARKAKE